MAAMENIPKLCLAGPLGVLLTFQIQIVQCPYVIEKRNEAHFPTVMGSGAAKGQVFQMAGSCSCCRSRTSSGEMPSVLKICTFNEST